MWRILLRLCLLSREGQQLAAGGLGNRRDRRVFNAALGRDGVKALLDIDGPPDDADTIFRDNIILKGGG